MFYGEGGETLAQVAQRGGFCPISGNIQDQVGRGLDGAVSDLIQLQMSLLVAEGMD